jgi:endonuclease/exonuclease/phosphatase family metal-dependent hydrolase
MRTALKVIALLIALPIIYVAANLTYSTIYDFSPPEMGTVQVFNPQDALPDSTVSLLIWNIGYAGLGKESDFFYDGGTTVRMGRDITAKNLDGILATLSAMDSVDIILLQEVDTLAKRSWWTNQFSALKDALPGHGAAFTLNYNVDFVPIPFLDPMGRVMGGLASFGRFATTSDLRYQFPSSFGWPDRIYFLDRCFLEQRIPLADGRELVIINTHNSAFDDGSLKAAEMAYLREHLLREERKGNPVIVGGDWNQGAPGTGFQEVGNPFIEGWQWAYDTSFGTNRDLKAAYVAGRTETFVIDFFLVSPGVEVQEVRVIDLGFENSDHQPVYLRVNIPR